MLWMWSKFKKMWARKKKWMKGMNAEKRGKKVDSKNQYVSKEKK